MIEETKAGVFYELNLLTFVANKLSSMVGFTKPTRHILN